MNATIVIATKFKQPDIVKNTLESIYKQEHKNEINTILVDDNDEPQESLKDLIDLYDGGPWHFSYLYNTDRCPCNNPAYARNFGYKQATGDILICASDDIILPNPDTLQNLLDQFDENKILVPHTINAYCRFDNETQDLESYDYINDMVSPAFFPYMFLGLVARKHMFAVGGNHRSFIHSGFEDRLVVECLQNHCKLQVEYSDELVLHQHHIKSYHSECSECNDGNYSGKLYWDLFGKMTRGEIPWTSDTAPWSI
jgi:glycosyltransferase involved in cell wall biosynthesis